MDILISRPKLLFIAFLLLSITHLIKSQEVKEDEPEFSYDGNSERGPSHWGELQPEWSLCGAGKKQSPINLLSKPVLDWNLGSLKKYYTPSIATLVNRGHDMKLTWEFGGGYLFIDGIGYQLKQCHWHSPSEHAVNGIRFDLELHLVHQTSDGKIAVIGIMYKIGIIPDPFLSRIENDIRELAKTHNVKKYVGIISPNELGVEDRKYFRYMGSLSTPPCTEGVVWTVLGKVRSVTKQQVALIRDALHEEPNTNARPLQPINERIVIFDKPLYSED